MAVKNKIQKIQTSLFFETQAEDAARFYTSIFKNSKISRITPYGKVRYEAEGITEGTVMTVEFEMEGKEFIAFNGGPQFKFTEAISLIVNCETQEELDYYWNKLSEGSDKEAQACGWLKDKYGVSWQILPDNLNDMLDYSNPEKSDRVMKALLETEKKIDIKTLKKAYEG